MADDNLIAGLVGALQGVERTTNMFLEDALYRRRKREDKVGELDLYREKLPLQQASEMETARMKSGLELESGKSLEEYKSGLPVRENPADYVPGSDVLAFEPTLAGIDPNKKYNKALLPLVSRETTVEKLDAKRKDKLKSLKPKAVKSIENATAGFDEMETNIDKLLNDKSLGWGTGWMSYLKSIPLTKAKEIENTLKTIKSAVSLDSLQEMRNNSPTGGALGNVSDAEGQRLENKRATLDPADAKFKDNLIDLKKSIRKSKDRIKKSYEIDFEEEYQGSSDSNDDPLGLGL